MSSESVRDTVKNSVEQAADPNSGLKVVREYDYAGLPCFVVRDIDGKEYAIIVKGGGKRWT